MTGSYAAQNRVLADFGNDGRTALRFLIEASPWGSIDQAIASLSIFAHPDVVAATGGQAIFRTVRGKIQDRGKIANGVMFDDNTSPSYAFEWSTGFVRSPGSDIMCCHLYAQSTDPEAYTDLRNIFYLPTFLSKLTDSQAARVPDRHALHVLRFRAFELYGYCGPGQHLRPAKPEHYDAIEWGATLGAGTTAASLEAALRARLLRRAKDRLTKSVSRDGWAFSDGRPDPAVIYTGL